MSFESRGLESPTFLAASLMLSRLVISALLVSLLSVYINMDIVIHIVIHKKQGIVYMRNYLIFGWFLL